MTDTAQPQAAETDAFASAATAFKDATNPVPRPEQPRAPDGKFVSPEPQEPEPAPENAEDDVEEVAEEAAEAEPDEAEEAETEGEEEAQQDPLPMPVSWSKEDEQSWSSLPVEVQKIVSERETQREQAVNRKYEEAANVRKTYESKAMEAQQSREEYMTAVDQVIDLLMPQEPPISMLNTNSGDYDPDSYHILKAQHEQARSIAASLQQQRQGVAAQHEQEAQRLRDEQFRRINEATADAFVKDVPEVTDRAKAADLVQELQDYALKAGAPPEMFETPTTVLEWHLWWKAREYDRMQEAKGKVATTPKPKQPAVRPGVTTPRSTVQKQQRNKDFNRLRETGSIADGAAVFKHFMKG